MKKTIFAILLFIPFLGMAQTGEVSGFVKADISKNIFDIGSTIYIVDSAKCNYKENLSWGDRLEFELRNGIEYKFYNVGSFDKERRNEFSISSKYLKRYPKDQRSAKEKLISDSLALYNDNIRNAIGVNARKTVVDRDGKYKFERLKDGVYYVSHETKMASFTHYYGDVVVYKITVKNGELVEQNFEY